MRVFGMLIVGLILCLPYPVFAGRPQPMPKREHVEIPDGEALTYGVFEKGVRVGLVRFVTVFTDVDTIQVYGLLQMNDDPRPTPVNYRQYPLVFTVNLKTSSVTHYVFDDEEYFVKLNKAKGEYFQDIQFGPEILATTKSWDGYQSTEQKYRVRKVDTSFPIMNNTSFLILGSRLLDWDNSKGSVMIWETWLKDPLAGTLYKLKSEQIKTPLGTFQTSKLGWKVADPFMGSLVKNVTNLFFFSIEDGPLRRIIQLDNGIDGQQWYLEKAEVVQK